MKARLAILLVALLIGNAIFMVRGTRQRARAAELLVKSNAQLHEAKAELCESREMIAMFDARLDAVIVAQTNVFTAGFKNGVRYGFAAWALNTNADNISDLTAEARQLYQLIAVEKGAYLQVQLPQKGSAP